MNIKKDKLVYVCGFPVKESLKHALFYIKYNASFVSDATPTFDDSFKLVGFRKYFTSECTRLLLDYSSGSHILAIRHNPDHPTRASSLTHIVTF